MASVFSVCRKTSIVIQKWVFSVARSAGFASCKTFGKQPKHPCFGRSPKAGRRDASPRIHPRHGCRACMPKALHDAEPTKHTQPFTGERGQGDRDNKSKVYFKNILFLQTEKPMLFGIGFFNLLLYSTFISSS